MIACDGIWDCVTNEECCKKMGNFLAKPDIKNDNISPCVEKLFEEILAPNTEEGIGTDNMTAIFVVPFNNELKN